MPPIDWGHAPDLATIEAMARATLAHLPAPFARLADQVRLVIEELADETVLAELGIDDPFALSGLYSGRPVGELAQTGDLPPTIHLYRAALLDEWCAREVRLDALVAHVVVHELGHHLGLSDADMHALEQAALPLDPPA